jgi:hypothetical protein
MVNPELIDVGEIVHGVFNGVIAIIFMYQGFLGLRIRRKRTAEGSMDFSVVRKHRKIGPALVFLGIIGFLAGITLVLVDKGKIVAFPLHFILGLLVVLLILAVYLASKKIGAGTEWRAHHALIGLVLLCLYVVQVIIGLDVVF